MFVSGNYTCKNRANRRYPASMFPVTIVLTDDPPTTVNCTVSDIVGSYCEIPQGR